MKEFIRQRCKGPKPEESKFGKKDAAERQTLGITMGQWDGAEWRCKQEGCEEKTGPG